MTFLNSSFFTILLGFTSYLLGLAILVNIVQEMYKYLTSSKSKAYSKALNDFLGPWAVQLLRGNFNLIARGPFQWLRLRPTGNVQPMDRDQLVRGLEKTAPYWVRRTFDQIKQEIAYQEETPQAPSPSWKKFLDEMGKAEKGTAGYWNTLDVVKWLSMKGHGWNDRSNKKGLGPISPPDSIDAKDLLVSFTGKFLPHIQEASEQFPQFQKNFEFTYKRRNLRQTFIFALVIALAFQLNIGRIYKSAENMTTEEAIAMLESLQQMQIHQDVSDEEALKQLKSSMDDIKSKVLDKLEPQTHKGALANIFFSWKEIRDMAGPDFLAVLKYLFECLITAILISFGAPLWNDLATLLFRLQKGRGKAAIEGGNHA